MNQTTQPSFHEELAAHLAGQETPKPHPESYCHGYVKPAGACCTGACNQGRDCPARASFKVEIDIDPHRAALDALRARADHLSAKAERYRNNEAKPTGPENEDMPLHVTTAGVFWGIYLALAVLAIIVGVRGCAA